MAKDVWPSITSCSEFSYNSPDSTHVQFMLHCSSSMCAANNAPLFAFLLTIITTTSFLTGGALQQQQPPSSGGGDGCIPAERAALLSFKKGIASDSSNRLASWRGQDCCRWRGVRCSNETSHVLELRLRNGNRSPGSGGCDDVNALFGEISPSLLSLEQLEHMDFSMNCLKGRREAIPSFLGAMKNLRYLNLSGIPFNGEVPPQLGNLSRLQYLDLGTQDLGSNLYSADITWLTNLHSLEYLSMRQVNLSRISDWPHMLNRNPSLRVIHLQSCSLGSANQSLPRLNLTKLEKLDLSGNSFYHEIASCWFWKATSLKYLDLAYNRLFGQFADALGNMASLQVLDLSYNFNNLVMKGNFKNLCSLEILDLTYNGMKEDITLLLKSLPQCAWDTLQELHLSSNNFTGTLPNMIGSFTSLTALDMSSNNLTGNLPPEFWHLSGLITLDISDNHLSGIVPAKLGAFTNLTSLDLRNNNLSGVIMEEHFGGLISLRNIDLSSNNLKVVVGTNWLPLFSLKVAVFASCQMGPLFPAWLQRQLEITKLDISRTGLADKIPDWFWPTFSQATYIDISDNQLSGSLPAHLGDMACVQLYLGSNQLTGPIPSLPRNITILDMSNNSFSGTLPKNLEAQELQTLIMYSNQIGGSIPGSLCKLNSLVDLDLSSNLLEGEIPSCLESEFSQNIKFLLLSNNSLSGEFPAFLRKSTSLQFLDLAWNKFFGRLPRWIGELNYLQFLRLSHNTLSWNIPDEITSLSRLQYLDLSSNNFTGVIPLQLSNLTAMTLKDFFPLYGTASTLPADGYGTITGQFGQILSITMKGQQLGYGSPLAYFVGIDLSGNSLTGEIPTGITSLDALISLNLSSNHLTGKIPNKIGALQSLESLDLSKNKLFGEIPSSLSNLTSLSYLNLSYNSLSGRIPSGRQLDTLSPNNQSLMYIGNSGLCGPPLQKNCSRHGTSIPDYHRSSRHELEPLSFYLGLMLGLVVGLWMVFFALLFKKTWRIAYFRFFDKQYDRIYVFVVLKWVRLTRKEVEE
ncbi:hypothetical protein ACP70R_002998 [Stipagrostis hirtigluma subsp. patula]